MICRGISPSQITQTPVVCITFPFGVVQFKLVHYPLSKYSNIHEATHVPNENSTLSKVLQAFDSVANLSLGEKHFEIISNGIQSWLLLLQEWLYRMFLFY